MNRYRQITLAVLTLTIILGAGAIVQRDMPVQVAAPEADPVNIQPVAAGPEEPEIVLPATGPARLQPTPVPVAPPEPPPPATLTEAPDCALDLQAVPQDHAMIAVTLVAPCAPLTRVVLKHAGLAVTGKTSANGVLMMALPALEVQASIAAQVRGETVTAGLSIPEVAGLQRFAVQWLQDDAFQVNAFEDGADYGGPGHVSAKAPHLPRPGMPASGGYLTQLGAGDVDLAMQAEVYTFPTRGNADLVIEAAVTPATCGRELLGEALLSRNGNVAVQELTLAMPDCSGIGDIVLLKNPVAEMKLAAQ